MTNKSDNFTLSPRPNSNSSKRMQVCRLLLCFAWKLEKKRKRRGQYREFPVLLLWCYSKQGMKIRECLFLLQLKFKSMITKSQTNFLSVLVFHANHAQEKRNLLNSPPLFSLPLSLRIFLFLFSKHRLDLCLHLLHSSSKD